MPEPNYNPRSKNYGKICPISRNKIHDILTNTFYYGAMYVADEEIDEKTVMLYSTNAAQKGES